MAGKEISGTYTDSDGNPVEGATVLLWREKDPGIVATTTTDADGNYSFSKHPGASGLVEEWHVAAYNIIQNDDDMFYNSFSNPRVTAVLSPFVDSPYEHPASGVEVDVSGVSGTVEAHVAGGEGEDGEGYNSTNGGKGGYVEMKFDVGSYDTLRLWAPGGRGDRSGYGNGQRGDTPYSGYNGGNGAGSGAIVDGQGNLIASAGGGGGGGGNWSDEEDGGDGGDGGGPNGGHGGRGGYHIDYWQGNDGGDGGQEAHVGEELSTGTNSGNGWVELMLS